MGRYVDNVGLFLRRVDQTSLVRDVQLRVVTELAPPDPAARPPDLSGAATYPIEAAPPDPIEAAARPHPGSPSSRRMTITSGRSRVRCRL